jgi:hypothetical protein
MSKLRFRWAFNDSLLLRLLAFISAASSGTKVRGAAQRPQLSSAQIWDVKRATILLKPLPLLHFSQSN